MGEFIYFTEEQKRQASEVDLESFLACRGEKMIPSGHEKRLCSDHSVTIRGNTWFDHETQKGGGPVSFLETFQGMSYSEAILILLGGENGQAFTTVKERVVEPKAQFELPKRSDIMRRMYGYLAKSRMIDWDIISHFVRAGLLYEDEKYHNCVFVGTDQNGVPRHAHKRSTNNKGKAFRINVEGSDLRYCFHHNGTDGSLYVFEAPIDLLSYISLHQDGWETHNYTSCCGTSSIPVLQMLGTMKAPEMVFLCLDNDKAGQAACERMEKEIKERYDIDIRRLIPELKDWNDDLVNQKREQEVANLCPVMSGL